MTAGAVLVPGYGASAEQPIVRLLAARLRELGFDAQAIAFTRARPTEPFTQELTELRAARDALKLEDVALIGRSFGGRVCARLAAAETPKALVLLGHPIAPSNRPRPEDEQALSSVRCPTLIVQGSQDRLGPLDVLRKIAAVNRNVEIHVLDGVGHQFGQRLPEAIDRAAGWLQAKLHA